MFKFHNANPRGCLTGDCVKRAISTATSIDYDNIKRALNRYKKITGAVKFNDNNNWRPFIEKECKGIKMSFPAKAGIPRMNGERFCETYPKGRYILRMARHLTCCIDGVILDTWDCSEKTVYNAWEVR